VSTYTTGIASELRVAARYLDEGKVVAMPYGSVRGWDLLVLEAGKWLRVQVKTMVVNRKYKSVNLFTHHGRGKRPDWESEFDLLVAVDRESGEMVKMTSVECGTRTGIGLTKTGRW
jgi:hypothetical protein